MANFMGGPGCTKAEVDIAQHVKALKRMRASIDDSIKRIGRKKWRPSEKAMTIASFLEDARALEFAISALLPKPNGEAATYKPGENNA